MVNVFNFKKHYCPTITEQAAQERGRRQQQHRSRRASSSSSRGRENNHHHNDTMFLFCIQICNANVCACSVYNIVDVVNLHSGIIVPRSALLFFIPNSTVIMYNPRLIFGCNATKN